MNWNNVQTVQGFWYILTGSYYDRCDIALFKIFVKEGQDSAAELTIEDANFRTALATPGLSTISSLKATLQSDLFFFNILEFLFYPDS